MISIIAVIPSKIAFYTSYEFYGNRKWKWIAKVLIKTKKNYHVIWLLFDAIYGRNFCQKVANPLSAGHYALKFEKIILKNVDFSFVLL